MTSSPGDGDNPGGRQTLFYRVDLFEHGQLTGIEFFDARDLARAKQRAVSAVADGIAHRSEVRDDAQGIVYRYPDASGVQA